MEPNAARFPFPLPRGSVGEYKAKVKDFLFALRSPAARLILFPKSGFH